MSYEKNNLAVKGLINIQIKLAYKQLAQLSFVMFNFCIILIRLADHKDLAMFHALQCLHFWWNLSTAHLKFLLSLHHSIPTFELNNSEQYSQQISRQWHKQW